MADGWLQAPDQREVAMDYRDSVCHWCNEWAFIDHVVLIPGEPALLKRRRVPPQW